MSPRSVAVITGLAEIGAGLFSFPVRHYAAADTSLGEASPMGDLYPQRFDLPFAESAVVHPDVVDDAVEIEECLRSSFPADVHRFFVMNGKPVPDRAASNSVQIKLVKSVLENSCNVIPGAGLDRISRERIRRLHHPMPDNSISQHAELEISPNVVVVSAVVLANDAVMPSEPFS